MLRVDADGINVAVAQEVGDLFWGCSLLKQPSCASVAQRVSAHMIEFDSKLPHARRHGPPHGVVSKWPPGATFAKEEVPVVHVRAGKAKISEDCFSRFVLDRELLDTATFGAPNGD